MTLYFDCNATTPVDSRVIDAMIHVLQYEVGNAGSTHALGRRAKAMVHKARDQIGTVVNARRHEIIFTSGATEANNLAILGLAPFGVQNKRQHIVSSAIEHKAVLEPLSQLQKQGFEITIVPVDSSGRIDADKLLREVREDTLLVSLMHANNETGVLQPITEVAAGLDGNETYLH
ncbi:MAG: aminotransferase class V-fold PLP-dependent enzyme, partial [Planctomycetaceae bacterium]|nr:aminotransferase class V-fold PLP-dependent enzyme [Planctomycetaceae bacterium]